MTGYSTFSPPTQFGMPRPGPPNTFEDIPLCLGRRQTNPQAGLAGDREVDPRGFTIHTAPSIQGYQVALEALELYWMTLLRDVAFTQWAQDEGVRAAVEDLNTAHPAPDGSVYPGPRRGGLVTPDLLFRGCEPGSRIGPYVSQFLLHDVPYAAINIKQRIQTARRSVDSLILLAMNAPFDEGNPYRTSCEPNKSRTQIGFTTFGAPHVLALLSEVTTRAHRAAWYQKWQVHRRLRPEVYGGLIQENELPNGAIRTWLINREGLQRTYARFGMYLLPQAYPEGSPTHPSYPSGHATVAGACVTI